MTQGLLVFQVRASRIPKPETEGFSLFCADLIIQAGGCRFSQFRSQSVKEVIIIIRILADEPGFFTGDVRSGCDKKKGDEVSGVTKKVGDASFLITCRPGEMEGSEDLPVTAEKRKVFLIRKTWKRGKHTLDVPVEAFFLKKTGKLFFSLIRAESSPADLKESLFVQKGEDCFECIVDPAGLRRRRGFFTGGFGDRSLRRGETVAILSRKSLFSEKTDGVKSIIGFIDRPAVEGSQVVLSKFPCEGCSSAEDRDTDSCFFKT